MTDNVILVGFMGAGKSSVGRILAARLGRCFVETDDMITAKEGLSIPEIFATRGEAYFRAAEEEALGLLARKRGDVIATGPMLAGKSREEAEALYHSREAFYRQADLTVDTVGIGVDQVAARVLRRLRSRTRVSS